MPSKRICFVVSSPLTVNAFLRNHITELARFYDIYLVANLNDSDQNVFRDLPVREVIPIEIVRDIIPYKDLAAKRKLTKLFRERKFDAVHSVTPKAGLLAMLAAKKAGIRKRIHIFTGQVWHTKKGMFKRLLMFIDTIIVNAATVILVDGESQRKFLIENRIINEQNSKVLGKGSISGVDEKRFLPSEDIRKRMRKEQNFSDDEVVFTFLGRMNADKGIKELVTAFTKLSAKFPKTKLLLIGYDEDKILEFVNEKVSDKSSVIFFGPTSKPEEILQSADVFCLPSHREGFGTSVLEASLLGLPVICSDTYGLSETMIDNVTGLRHKVGDELSIYEQLEFFCKNPDKRISMGTAGRQYVLGNFTASMITDAWVSFYHELLGDS